MLRSLHARMLVGLLAGASLGAIAHAAWGDTPALARVLDSVVEPVGQIFLRLLFMLVLPLLVSALALGVVGLGNPRELGRVGLRTLVYTVVVSGIAVLLGVTLVEALRPGDGITPAARARLLESAAQRDTGFDPEQAPEMGIDLLVQIVPRNPIDAAAKGDMLAVMFFALMLGVGMALTRTPAVARLTEVLQGLYDVSMRLIGFVIQLAPIGVAALVFGLTAQLGSEILVQLARYVGVVLLGLALHLFGTYSLAVRLLGGMSPARFFRGAQEAMITAFSTASSNATLPTALRVAEEELHLPRDTSRFVLTIGSTANQNGTALFEGVTVLFLAQVYGVDLSLLQQALVAGVCVLGGVGTAGVPAGSLPVIAVILGMIGVPVEGIGLILGVDRFLDMCRTTLNVTGDLAAAVVISARERREAAA